MVRRIEDVEREARASIRKMQRLSVEDMPQAHPLHSAGGGELVWRLASDLRASLVALGFEVDRLRSKVA